MKQFILLCFTIISISAFPQSKQLKDYYSSVYKAEFFILYNQLDSSYYYYDRAFKEWSTPFARDVYNAALIYSKYEDFINEKKNFRFQ